MTKGAFLSFRNDLKASNPKKMLKQTKNVIKARGINKGEGAGGAIALQILAEYKAPPGRAAVVRRITACPPSFRKLLTPLNIQNAV